jgi:pimeloyl-ACP methyl ester carboxylesterase
MRPSYRTLPDAGREVVSRTCALPGPSGTEPDERESAHLQREPTALSFPDATATENAPLVCPKVSCGCGAAQVPSEERAEADDTCTNDLPDVARTPDESWFHMKAIRERKASLHSGVVLPYAETGRPGSSTPVLFVHAFVESWRYFEPVLRSLPPSIHAFAPTQRGHRSVDGDPNSYQIGDFASDIVEFMDAVGVARAVLVGASSGGLTCQVVATGHPQRVRALVLISAPVTLADKPAVIAMREDITALSDPIDPRFVERFVRGTGPSQMAEELVERLVTESLGIPAEVWRESFLGLLQAVRPEALENLRVPTLLLCGGGDTFVRDDQQFLLDRIPGAELVVYDGVGHGPHLAQPNRVAADVAAFVRRHR